VTLDIDHLRTWIGREEVQSELVTTALVQRFNATFDWESSLEEGGMHPF
jgi:3-methylfumaryl-CoA hydratase